MLLAGPLAARAMLKGFHTRVGACVRRHAGLVVTFTGDGAICAFGLAEPGPEDARRALAAAFDLVPTVRLWLAGESSFGGRGGDLRVGVHHWTVVVSRLGAEDHQHITATGDTLYTSTAFDRLKNAAVPTIANRTVTAVNNQDWAVGTPLNGGPEA